MAGVLLSPPRIQRRVRSLAKEIERDSVDEPLTVVALLTGTVLFLADLVRHLPIPMQLDFIGISSYRTGTTPSKLFHTKDLSLEIRGRDVLVVDDILDTGATLEAVLLRLRRMRPSRIRTCVLLEKTRPQIPRVRADYVGFRIPDVFVVGYGLDYAEQFRNLAFIGVLNPGAMPPAAQHTRYRRRPSPGRPKTR